MRLVGMIVGSFIIAAALASVRGTHDASATPPPPVAAPAPTAVVAPAAPVTPATALQAARAEMRRRIDDVLARPVMKGHVGIKVVSLDTGEELYARNAGELFNPASNVKLFTGATALAKLGPEFRYRTDFFCKDAPVKGECKTLYIRGRGDPTLYTERIYGIVGELSHRGLRRVGEVIVDESYFDDQHEGPGWDQEDGDKPYMAPVGALSVNHNTVAIYVSPGDAPSAKARIDLEPMSDYFIVDNKVQTVSRRSRARLKPQSTPAPGERQRISVTGRLPVNRDTAVFYKKVDHPAMYAGETFKSILKERGIAVKGRVRHGTVPVDAVRLYVYKSPALAEIVREMDKVSNNFVAEMLLKTVGAEVKGTPGSWAKGISAAEEYLAELGVPKGTFVMKNGSGLNDTNRFTPSQIITLLGAVANKSTFYPEYASSLGIAGRDGTIRSRMEGSVAEGRLRGKTGTLENVAALSGYVTLASGEMLAYSILVNGITKRQHHPAVASIDDLGVAIASGGGPVLASGSALAANNAADLKARVATFASLGKVPNPDNLPFLRSALRSEKDPMLHAVIADTLYRCDPETEVGDLIDSVPTDLTLFARLRAIGQELQIPTPMVSSLIDIGADGNPDALDKLITLAHQLKDDTETNALLADGFEEIGRTAPDELLEAIHRASPEVSGEAVGLLGQGIAASDEKATHPFFENLKTLAEGKSTDKLTPTALSVSDRLHKILSEPKQAATTTEPKISPASATGTALPGGG